MRAEEESDVDAVLQELRPMSRTSPWRVRDAKAKLTEVMSSCHDGSIEVIGLRDPVVMMSVRELSRIVARSTGPRTWGALFAPSEGLPGSGVTLEVPEEHEAPPLALASGER